MVLQTCLIMLDAADVVCLVRYRKHIVKLAATFGPACWPLLYQTEYRFRREEMTRIHREESIKYNNALLAQSVYAGFNINRPYAGVWAIATSKEFSDYWTENVKDKSFQVLIRRRQLNHFIDGDCPVAANAFEHMATSGTNEHTVSLTYGSPNPAPTNPRGKPERTPRATPKAQPQAGKGKHQHHVVNGRYVANRAGTPLCDGFQKGTCHGKRICPLDNYSVHVCNRCLQDHGGDTPQSCKKTAPANPTTGVASRNNPKGNGGGGGKGGKKGGGKKGVKKAPWWQA